MPAKSGRVSISVGAARLLAASEGSGNNLNGLKDYCRRAKARIWPPLSCEGHKTVNGLTSAIRPSYACHKTVYSIKSGGMGRLAFEVGHVFEVRGRGQVACARGCLDLEARTLT
jgi:hypothetical protein